MTEVTAQSVQTISRPRSRRAHLIRQIRKNWAAYVFISPFYILYLFFGLFALIFSFYVSLHRWDGLTPMRWMGVGNYIELFNDALFWNSIRVTFFLLMFDIPFKVFTPLVLAVMLNSRMVRAKSFFRGGYYLPQVTSSVVVATMFAYLFNRDTGFVNFVLALVGIEPINWLFDQFWARICLVLLSAWASQGWHMVIYLAGLQGIPNEVIEAAIVDGANHRQIFFRITMPLLQPMIVFTAIIATISGLQRFAEPFLLTNGGPQHATTTAILFLYQRAFSGFRLGYASALGYILFLMIFIFSLLQLKFGGRGTT